jgi:Flp pilus assembly protein TadB
MQHHSTTITLLFLGLLKVRILPRAAIKKKKKKKKHHNKKTKKKNEKKKKKKKKKKPHSQRNIDFQNTPSRKRRTPELDNS